MKRLLKLRSGAAIALLIAMLLAPFILSAAPREINVGGVVTDRSTGETLPGVSVKVKSSQNRSVVTDIDGKYSIRVNSDAVLVFSYIGCKPVEERVNNRSTIDVAMESDANVLQETVVIGYGSVKKSDITGSVGSINSKELLKTSPVSINQGLQGKLAGVNVAQSDGAPGAGINIQIRGANSFTTSTEPLYVVDGIPFIQSEAPSTDYGMKQKNNPLSSISPQDIESIEVLKDASATAIYGSRGANGVVIITTKSGRDGNAKVTFTTTLSVSNPVKKIDVLSAADYAEFRNEIVINGYLYDGKNYVAPSAYPYPIPGYWKETTSINPETGLEEVVKREYLPSPDDFRKGFYYHEGDTELFHGTNWQDQIFHTAFSQDYNLSVSGGNEKGGYLYSAGYLDQQGVIRNSYYKRFTARANNNRKVKDFLEIGSFLSFTKSDNRLARTNSEDFAVIKSAVSFSPVRPVFDPEADSGFSEDFATGLANPYLSVMTEKNILYSTLFSGTGYAEVTFTPWLKFRQNIGYYYSHDERDQYYNRYTGAGQSPTNGYAVKSDGTYESFTEESLLTFDKQFSVHHINAVLGMTYEKVTWKGKSMNAKTFPSDATEDNSIGDAVGDKEISSYRGKSQLMSFLFRVNYNLMDRYLLTVSYRRDGSSRLANHRWSGFYSGAIGWRLSEEKFMKDWGFFDNFKIRLSAGQTGNQGVNAYATRSKFVSQNYPFGGVLSSGLGESIWDGPAAPDLKWETTDQYDAGVDLSILRNRVNITFDAYYKKTRDLLQYRLIPMSSGFTQMACNFGNVENKGIELSGHFIPFTNKDWQWSIDANITWNRNKISGLNADQFSDVVFGMESVFLRRNGYAIGTLYGYVEDGFYDNEAEVRANPLYANESNSKVKSMVGQIKYKNLDDDPSIDDRDKTIIGDTNPDYQYGFSTQLNWKRWGLGIFFQGTHGNDIVNANLLAFDMTSSNNMPYFVWNNRWTPENRANATWPRADGSYTRSLKVSDRYIEDGSYLRCKNISLTYNWPHPFKFVDNIMFTASVNNLFTITNYSWYDPDVNAFGSDAARRGIDLSSYPSARTYNFNIQMTF